MIFLIPAAGRGTRTGLPYPKCLHKYNGTEIIISNLKKIHSIACQKNTVYRVVVLISVGTEDIFSSVFNKYSFPNLEIHFEQQLNPEGTASAVLQSSITIETNCTDRFCIIWGDCIGYTEETLQRIIQYEYSDVVIPGLYMKRSYTKFEVDKNLFVLCCEETKGLKNLMPGYTDIGLFTINDTSLLFESLPEFIQITGNKKENSFIDFISYCCKKNVSVQLLDCCAEEEKKGFNSFEDLNG